MNHELTALRRWRLGHHAFHLHLVVLNTVLSRASRSYADHRWADLVTDLERLRVLFDGATATMHFSAGFEPDEYHRVVRPSMEPPFLEPGFSASFGREHEVMLRRAARLNRLLRAAGDVADGRPTRYASPAGNCGGHSPGTVANTI